MTDEIKADCVLTDGREIYFDFKKVTIREWREMVDAFRIGKDGEPSIMSKLTGISDEDFAGSNVEDLRILDQLMYRAYRRPLAIPK